MNIDRQFHDSLSDYPTNWTNSRSPSLCSLMVVFAGVETSSKPLHWEHRLWTIFYKPTIINGSITRCVGNCFEYEESIKVVRFGGCGRWPPSPLLPCLLWHDTWVIGDAKRLLLAQNPRREIPNRSRNYLNISKRLFLENLEDMLWNSNVWEVVQTVGYSYLRLLNDPVPHVVAMFVTKVTKVAL